MARAVRWDLIANPAGYNRGFREAERTSTRFQRHMDILDRRMTRSGASFAALGGAAKAGVASGVVALSSLAAAGVAMGLKTAAGLESAEIGFTQLLKSSKRAKAFIGELKTFAAKTPFELPGLVDASRALLGAGVEAKKVIPIMTALGDASGALGLDQERFGRVMTAVTQIMNKGKVQAEELMQINEAGIPVWQLLAKATGKPVPELQKLMEQGKLLSKDVLPKLFEQMRKDYGGGMERQSRSLAGVWSTFKDTVSLTLSDALQPLLPWLKEKLPVAAETFKGAIENVQTFFKKDLRPELDRVIGAWDRNEDSFKGLLDTFSSGDDQLDSTKEQVSSLADSVVTLTDKGGQLARRIHDLNEDVHVWEAGMDGAAKAMRIQFVIPVIGGFQKVISASLTMGERTLAVAATMAEALHLPQARALRQAQQDLVEYRRNFNLEMNKLLDETVKITATPGFKFTSSFTKADWFAARVAAGRAAGGMRITQGTTPTADDVLLRVSKGETVVSAKHSARPEFQAWAGAMGIPGFATGGAIRPRFSIGPLPSEVTSFGTTRHGIAALMGGWTGRILDTALKRLFTGSARIRAFIRAMDHHPYLWGGVGPGGWDCSGATGSVYALMKHLNPFRRYFTTQSSFPALGFRPGPGGTYQIGVDRAAGHMAGRYGGLAFEARNSRAGILVGNAARSVFSFPQLYHMARGGRITSSFKAFAELFGRSGAVIGGDPGRLRIDSFDRGGWLLPGLSLAYNGTGRPEPVGTSGFTWYGDVHIHNPQGDPTSIRQVARRAILEVLDAQARRARQGGRA